MQVIHRHSLLRACDESAIASAVSFDISTTTADLRRLQTASEARHPLGNEIAG